VRGFETAHGHFKINVIKLLSKEFGNFRAGIALHERIAQVVDDVNEGGNVEAAHGMHSAKNRRARGGVGGRVGKT
jgi:hypothetical protein